MKPSGSVGFAICCPPRSFRHRRKNRLFASNLVENLVISAILSSRLLSITAPLVHFPAKMRLLSVTFCRSRLCFHTHPRRLFHSYIFLARRPASAPYQGNFPIFKGLILCFPHRISPKSPITCRVFMKIAAWREVSRDCQFRRVSGFWKPGNGGFPQHCPPPTALPPQFLPYSLVYIQLLSMSRTICGYRLRPTTVRESP